jgi:hypothetical protein
MKKKNKKKRERRNRYKRAEKRYTVRVGNILGAFQDPVKKML